MEQSKDLQALTSSGSSLPMLADSKAIVAVRLDRRKYPHYKDIPPKVRQEWMTLEFRKYSALAHIKDVSAKDLVVGAVALDEMMMAEDHIADLTQPEIEQAFKNGVFGKYGEYYGLTAMSLYGFLQSYLDSDEKREAASEILRMREKAREAEVQKQREAEKEQIMRELEEAKRNGFVPSWGPGFNFVPKKVSDLTDSSAHRAKVLEQAANIFRQNAKK